MYREKATPNFSYIFFCGKRKDGLVGDVVLIIGCLAPSRVVEYVVYPFYVGHHVGADLLLVLAACVPAKDTVEGVVDTIVGTCQG